MLEILVHAEFEHRVLEQGAFFRLIALIGHVAAYEISQLCVCIGMLVLLLLLIHDD